jgi:hypothetical protein
MDIFAHGAIVELFSLHYTSYTRPQFRNVFMSGPFLYNESTELRHCTGPFLYNKSTELRHCTGPFLYNKSTELRHCTGPFLHNKSTELRHCTGPFSYNKSTELRHCTSPSPRHTAPLSLSLNTTPVTPNPNWYSSRLEPIYQPTW